ncbi:MAG TPA: hypothetical protein VG733_10385 [Chthoniobacteraceae bacterium]|nr:hypothetical protein [Chthoniobacteraceae bacterium]
MNSPAHADAPAPAQRDDARHMASAWAKFVLGAAALLLVVEFALPGFLAAGCRRAFDRGYMPLAVVHVVEVMLVPAYWLASQSGTISNFYDWEFNVAKGEP